MRELITTQLNHRSIREFKPEPVPETLYQQLLDVAMRTPTSNGMQASSLIRITDQGLKDEIAQIANQEYIRRVPLLLVFIADQHRNQRIAQAKGVQSEHAGDADRFFQAVTDALLMAQNVTVAAEALGLGTFYIGSILNDSAKMVELLKLPPLTLPILGLAIGIPNQEPGLKPRMDKSLRVSDNGYQDPQDILASIATYDDEMATYYDLRDSNRRVDRFSDQVAKKLSSANLKRLEITQVIIAQGFKL